MMCSKCGIKCSVVTLILGVILLTMGCVMIPLLHNIIHEKIRETMPLVNGSESYNTWIDPPVPISFQIYVYHILNPKEVVQDGAKPAVIQKGPYTYREHKEKVDLKYTDDGHVTYREITWYYFDREKSSGPEDEKITTLNVPMMTVADMIRYEYWFIQELTEIILDVKFDSSLFIELTMKELMWGYEDKLLKYVNQTLQKYKQFNLGHVDDHFGFFYQRNGSDNGIFKINTGEKDVSNLALIETWNNQTKLNYWPTPWSNMLNGTDGTIFHPFIEKTDQLYFFNTDMCRSIYLTYKEDSSVKGIDTYKFVIPPEVFLDYHHEPDNGGFCTPLGKCLPSGLLNCTVCRNGAQAIVSQPHFLHANQSVIDSIYGMRPAEEMQTSLHLEPMTGVVFNANVKLQINVFIENVSHIRETEHIKPTVFPMFWFNETAIVADSLAESFRTGVEVPIIIMKYVQYGLIVLGAVVILISTVRLIQIKNSKRKNKTTILINDDTEDDESHPNK